MSEKKHIDRLFQEKFKDFEAKPNDKVWDNIQNQLEQPKEKNKSIIPIWFRLAGVAVALLLFFAIGNLMFNSSTEEKKPIVDTNTTRSFKKNTETEDNKNTTTQEIIDTNNLNESSTVSEDNNNKHINNNTTNALNKDAVASSDSKGKTNAKTLQKKVTSFNSQSSNKKVAIRSEKSNNRYTNNQETTTTNKSKSITENSEDKNNIKSQKDLNLYAQNTTVNNEKSKREKDNITSKPNTKSQKNLEIKNIISNTDIAANNSEKEEKKIAKDSANSSNAIEEAIAKINDLNEKEEQLNRWTVNANIAPVYYNTLGKGSHIDEQFVDNKKNGETNTSYGINVGYAFNKRLKVRSGVNQLNLSYDTANVIVYENVTNTTNQQSFRNIDFIPTNLGENISVLSASNFSVLQVSDVVNNNLNTALSQRISYLEVPLELEYALTNKRFGVHLIAGVSTFILNDNEVVTEVDNRKTKIGEANNINDVSFSANAGVGIDYKFTKKLKFNLEPTFKYQINAYNDTSGNFNPYIIGVYTGFSYKF